MSDHPGLTRREATAMLALGALAPAAIAHAKAPATLNLRILATSDLHCHLAAYDYYRDTPDLNLGLARTATLIAQARAEQPNALLFDNGDTIQGNPLGDLAAAEPVGEGHPVLRALATLRYDAATVGNHEFNYGLPFLEAALAKTPFPYTVANIDRTDGSPFLPRWQLLTRTFTDTAGAKHTLKIGVIGLCTPQIMLWDKSKLDGKVTTSDISAAARKYVPALRAAGADIVVVLSHSGIDSRARVDGEENASFHVAEVPGIDVLITGHSHRVFPSSGFAGLPDSDLAGGKIHGVPSVMPGCFGSHLGVIDLDLLQVGNGWRVSGSKAAVRAVADPTLVADPAFEAAIAADHQRTLEYIRRPVGKTTRALNSFFALVRDDPTVALVHAVQLEAAAERLRGGPHQNVPLLSAAAPFRSGFGGPDAYVDIPAGNLAIKNIADLYLYPNTLQIVAIDGAALRQWLEMSAGLFRQLAPGMAEPQLLLAAGFPTYNFDSIAGLDYQIDVSQPARYDRNGKLIQPAAQRITGLQYKGKPVADGDRFLVATSNYRAGGGGGFPGLDGNQVVLEVPDPTQQLIVAWVKQHGSFDPETVRPAGRWRLVAGAGPALGRFDSSPRAQDRIDDPRVRHLGPGEKGFATYAIQLDRS